MEFNKIKLEQHFRELIETNGYFFIDFIIRGEKRSKVIEVYIDNEKGINVDDCADVTRILNDKLVELGYSDESYRLDVSSPGSERELKYFKQYNKHVNHWFNVCYSEGEEVKEIEAKLKSIEGEELTFVKEQKEIKIQYNDIKQAKVIIRI